MGRPYELCHFNNSQINLLSPPKAQHDGRVIKIEGNQGCPIIFEASKLSTCCPILNNERPIECFYYKGIYVVNFNGNVFVF